MNDAMTSTVPAAGRTDPGAAGPAQGTRPRVTEEIMMRSLDQEPSGERIPEAELRHAVARVRALRRARRDARTRAARVRRALLLGPSAPGEVFVPRQRGR
ncbi:hypothetical protein [Actinomadura parmotrematis]|uniref:DUF3040 domain-containing protein n=1 Tax=Actinomadura parmotrematis TaxID=2864039 RepID=A0ABS7G1D6_9ACTN|nr:hypothetical protein [Actinomadura parmotrematis]MBW8486311.1 hypothetical protein [Actinomadura parmotrematis]